MANTVTIVVIIFWVNIWVKKKRHPVGNDALEYLFKLLHIIPDLR